MATDLHAFYGVPRTLNPFGHPGNCPECKSEHATNWNHGSSRRPRYVALCLDCKHEWRTAKLDAESGHCYDCHDNVNDHRHDWKGLPTGYDTTCLLCNCKNLRIL
jgi:hypothetical protein